MSRHTSWTPSGRARTEPSNRTGGTSLICRNRDRVTLSTPLYPRVNSTATRATTPTIQPSKPMCARFEIEFNFSRSRCSSFVEIFEIASNCQFRIFFTWKTTVHKPVVVLDLHSCGQTEPDTRLANHNTNLILQILSEGFFLLRTIFFLPKKASLSLR